MACLLQRVEGGLLLRPRQRVHARWSVCCSVLVADCSRAQGGVCPADSEEAQLGRASSVHLGGSAVALRSAHDARCQSHESHPSGPGRSRVCDRVTGRQHLPLELWLACCPCSPCIGVVLPAQSVSFATCQVFHNIFV